MTLVKSKYFMLKANFPKHAKLIDDQPIIDNHEPEKEFNFGAASDKQQSNTDEGLQEDNLQKKSMMNDPKHTLRVEDDSEEDRQAQYKKDQDAYDQRDKETEMLLKQLDNIKKIDALAKETNHADRFKNIQYIDRGQEPKMGSIFEKGQTPEDHSLEGKVDGEINIDLHGNVEVIDH